MLKVPHAVTPSHRHTVTPLHSHIAETPAHRRTAAPPHRPYHLFDYVTLRPLYRNADAVRAWRSGWCGGMVGQMDPQMLLNGSYRSWSVKRNNAPERHTGCKQYQWISFALLPVLLPPDTFTRNARLYVLGGKDPLDRRGDDKINVVCNQFEIHQPTRTPSAARTARTARTARAARAARAALVISLLRRALRLTCSSPSHKSTISIQSH